MMTDLFSSLDGCMSMMSWFPAVIMMYMYYNNMYMLSMTNNLKIFLTNLVFCNKEILHFGLFITTLMFFLININLLGLSPFTYTMSSSLWFASSIALVLWSLLLVSGIFFSWKKTLAHLVPAGSPALLIPFLIIIEMISILIRPLTLTVRLIANISAGHIVLSLIANCLTSLGFTSMLLILIVSVFYNMFEVFVCFIQAYIFTLLLKLYSLEHP
uniref:ATP synthase F0 subunit 6 n=1 Tax=Bulinus truncatus TaxID=55810 RepID=UPI001EE0E1A5|nr:ATP synthase F0 subunit 6 [Bulinus truncatus]QYJ56636.1 ATP synthase F0 subunit 6 [Bulinus truncatus]